MVQIDNSDIKTLVHALRTESEIYYRQWVVWLGVGSGAGGVGLLTFVASLPDRTYALRVIIPSLWLFLIGVCSAGLSVLFESNSMSSRAQHFAEAHNREEANQAISKIPEVFSSPQTIADEANLTRNDLIARSNVSHRRAERAWSSYLWWNYLKIFSVTTSALAFVAGAGWILFYLTFVGDVIPSRTGVYLPLGR